MKSIYAAFVAMGCTVAVAQVPVAIEPGQARSIKPDYVLKIAPDGRIVSRVPYIEPVHFEDAPSWAPAFDALQWNQTTNEVGSTVYRATPAPFWYLWFDNVTFPIYKSHSTCNDIVLASGTSGKQAKRIAAWWVWNPNGSLSAPGAGPAKDCVVIFSTANNFSSSATGPAVPRTILPGGGGDFDSIGLEYLSLDPGFWIGGVDLSAIGMGLPLPYSSGSVILTLATKSGSNIVGLTGVSGAAPVMGSVCSASDPFFAGTNPSNSLKWQWEDNRNGAGTTQTPDYAFQDTTTSAFTELRDNSTFGASMGQLNAAVGLIVDNNGVEITGTVTFNDLDDPVSTAPKWATFEIWNSAYNSLIDEQTVAISSSGAYRLIDPQPVTGGMYIIRLKKDTWLSRISGVVNTTTFVTQTGVNLSLINGDVDDDNEVTLVDFGLVSFAFGSIEGDPNWLAEADLNRDGEVNLVDVSIVSANFGQAGE